MSFDKLVDHQARLSSALLGGVTGIYYGDGAPVEKARAIIDKDVEVVVENGNTVTRSIVATFYIPQVGKVTEGHRFESGDKTYFVQKILYDDGVTVEAAIR